MTATEKLHQLLQTLPENQINEVLNFAEFLHQKQLSRPQSIPPGTLTGLRGIAKRPGAASLGAAQDRLAEIDTGAVQTIPGDIALAQIRQLANQ
jgi:Protein of unknown function (DUF2281)